MSGSSASAGYTYTTARTLLGILRLGQVTLTLASPASALLFMERQDVLTNLHGACCAASLFACRPQALARIRFSDEISQADVDEAMRLMHSSKASLYEPTQVR
jgi:hypothetical protein